MTRLADRESPVWDGLLAVVLATVMIVDVATMDGAREGSLAANVALAVVYGGLGAVRRRLPLVACFGFVALLFVLSAALTPPPEMVAIFLGLLVFPYTAGLLIRGPAVVAFLLLLLAGIAVANLAGDAHEAGDWIFPPAIAGFALLAGRNVVHRALLAAELHEAGLRAEEGRMSETRRAVADERRRIAREMHDVVAHSISVMVVQAGGARRIIERDPPRAAQAAELIERTGRETLEEMRRLLGVMREPGDAADRVPNPTLADLGSLCCRDGLFVDYAVVGEPQPVSAGFELGAFRVLEETLAELRRVAPDSRAGVTVTWTPETLTLTVTHDRSPELDAAQVLPAVRERVTLYGGTIDVADDRLDVRLPLNDQDPTRPVPAQGAA
jgi:signal transduction histidine kinase